MKIFISSDHAGYELKQHLVAYLKGKNIDVIDKGPFALDPLDDYPDLISLTAEEVSKDPENAMGIVIGLSGQGEAMAANKFKNVRAGLYYGGTDEILKLLREHNNANVLSLGSKFVSPEGAQKAVDIFIATKFSLDERHERRIEKISALEK
jgi:ribose 5-phosphate isomerase B